MQHHVRTDGGALHCPHCGEAVKTDHSYCIYCGGDLSDLHDVAEAEYERPDRDATSNASESEETDTEAFRKRVQYLVSRGWDIKYDAGDEVVLVDRGIGSLGIHFLLLIFTGGLGNLLYAWYHYTVVPQRVLLRADGSDYEVVDPAKGRTDATTYDNTSSSLGQFAFGLVLFAIGLVTIIATGLQPIPSVFGALFLFFSLFLIPPTRRRIRERHSPTTLGPTESVEQRYVTDTDRPCTVCGCRVDDGVVKDYKREQVVAGIPLYTIEDGENYYCTECHGRVREDAMGSNHNNERLEPATDALADETEAETPIDEMETDEFADEIDRELAKLRNEPESTSENQENQSTAETRERKSETELAAETSADDEQMETRADGEQTDPSAESERAVE